MSIHFRSKTRTANPLPQWILTAVTAHSNRGDAKNQAGPGDRLPTLSCKLIIKSQGWFTPMWSTGEHLYVYRPNRKQTNQPVVTSAGCCNIYPKWELVLQDFSNPKLPKNQKVSYGVPMYHFTAERTGRVGGKKNKAKIFHCNSRGRSSKPMHSSPLKIKRVTEQLQALVTLWSTFSA